MKISLKGNGLDFNEIDFADFFDDYLEKGLVVNYLLSEFDEDYRKVETPIGDFQMSELLRTMYGDSVYDLYYALSDNVDNLYSDLRREVDESEGDYPIEFLGYEILLLEGNEGETIN